MPLPLFYLFCSQRTADPEEVHYDDPIRGIQEDDWLEVNKYRHGYACQLGGAAASVGFHCALCFVHVEG